MARSARWRATKLKQYRSKLTAYSDTLDNLGARAVVDAARIGAETMQEIIATSGTGWENREGRIDTGKMIGDVDYQRVATRGLSKGSARVSRSATFGWIRHYEEYYGMQDHGFVNIYKLERNRGETWKTGEGGPPVGKTVGMNAYATAHLAAREFFRREINRLTKTAWRKTK